MRPTTSSSAAAEHLGELVGRQFQRGHRCPAGSIGISHSGHGRRPPVTASAPRAAIARTCGTGRVDPRDVADLSSPSADARRPLVVVVVVLVVFVGRALAQLEQHELALGVEAEPDQARPEERHRGLVQLRLDRRAPRAGPRGTRRRCGRGTRRPRSRAARPAPSPRAR